MKLSEINIRDPFVLCDGGKYYMYGTRGATCWGMATGFDVYVSDDLETWSDAIPCFQQDGTFWADRNYWAPEVHKVDGSYYMFASFASETRNRGTQILKSSSPTGPFVPHSAGPLTPPEWSSIDGTLYTDRQGKHYLVFVHEWNQVANGEMRVIPLTDDLSQRADNPQDEPKLLFRAHDAAWSVKKTHKNGVVGYITDGPFFWRLKSGKLLCLWASFSEEGYTEGVASSDNGEIDGKFVQEEPLFMKDGGHGMIFTAYNGQMYLALHSPNKTLCERPVFIPVHEEEDRLVADV